jgi:hypothetical protein
MHLSEQVPTNLPQELRDMGETDAADEEIPLFVHSAADDYSFKINPAAAYVQGADSDLSMTQHR